MLIRKRDIFSGKVVKLSVQTVKLPNGQTAELEIIDHPGGVAVLALDDSNQICLLQQYRYAASGSIWEIPAGTIEDGESPRQTAERELLEEAGAIAKRWTELGEIFTSPGVFRERMFLFLAEDLTLTNTEHETEEVISVHWKPVDEVLAWTDGGEIKDAKTLIAINYWRSNHQIE